MESTGTKLPTGLAKPPHHIANRVLHDAQVIATQAKQINIPPSAVASAAKKLLKEHDKGNFSIKNWGQNTLNPKTKDEYLLNWIFVVDTLNFSFWMDPGTTAAVQYNGVNYTGYWSLCAAINRANDEGIPITSPEYLSSITLDQVKHIFRTETEFDVPLLQERANVLKELGTVLKSTFNSKFSEIIRRSQQSAMGLVDLMMKHFSSFNDTHTYKNQQVRIAKRAQILVADIWAAFEGEGYGEFNDIDEVTMFADYRVPQTLLYLGLLEYDDKLIERLRSGELLESGSELEVEIRGCSIWAVELVKRDMKKLLTQPPTKEHPLNAIVIDFYLWDYAKEHADLMDHLPIHHTRSVFY